MIRLILKLLILPVLGMVIVLVPMVLFIQSVTDPPLAELRTPGGVEFNITEPGKYKVWHSYTGVINNTEFRTEDSELPAGLQVSLLNSSDQTSIPLTSSLGATVSTSDYRKESLFSADLTPGNYKLIASNTTEQVQLVVTKDDGFKGFLFIFICVGIGSIITIIGIILAAVALAKTFWYRTSSIPKI